MFWEAKSMKIVVNKQELEEHVIDLLKSIPGNKLLLDHYLDGAIEAEADAICDGENVYIIGIMEHIEPRRDPFWRLLRSTLPPLQPGGVCDAADRRSTPIKIALRLEYRWT